jgi:hypothetical protein
MKELLGVVLTIALMLGISGVAVQRFGDRETLVPPPDAVAEGFVREVMTKRWDRARASFDEPDAVSNREIAALQKAWHERVGDPSELEAETITRDSDQALVSVRMQSARGSEAVSFALRFHDKWTIVHTPAVGIPIH